MHVLATENKNHPPLVMSVLKCHHPLLGHQGKGLHRDATPPASGAVSPYSTQLWVLPGSLSVKYFSLFCYTVLDRQEAVPVQKSLLPMAPTGCAMGLNLQGVQ